MGISRPPCPRGWTEEEHLEFLQCGYVSFKSEAEVDEWCEMAIAEVFADIEAAEAKARQTSDCPNGGTHPNSKND